MSTEKDRTEWDKVLYIGGVSKFDMKKFKKYVW